MASVTKAAKRTARGVLKGYDRVTKTVGSVADLPRKWAGALVGEKNPYGIGDARGVPISLHKTRAEAFAEARSLAKSGQRVEVVWKTGKGYQSQWFGKSKGNPKNPEGQSQDMYEAFHGKPATSTVIVKEEYHVHENLATLGVLVEFWVAPINQPGKGVLIETSDAERDFDEAGADPDTVFLAANEDGTQLYFVGGDQSLDLDALKFTGDWVKDSMVIGVIYELTYRTRKEFDKFELTDYYHALGEETGDQPMLVYDSLSPHCFISGGKYKIKVPLIGMSPGIEN